MTRPSTEQKFRPERPIYLNTDNTNLKTKIEVMHMVERLRNEKQWLCAYKEDWNKPFHLSFNDIEKEYAEFKRDCETLGITLKSPTLGKDDSHEFPEAPIVEPEPEHSYEDSKGKIHKNISL